MKKLVIISIVAAMLLASGAAFGQAASHDVEIRIPNVFMLRITDGSNNVAATNPGVFFDFQAAANVDTYLNMVNAGGGDLVPTSVNNFGDVIVLSNQAWVVSVSNGDLTFDDNLGVDDASGLGLTLSDITVRPSREPGASVWVAENWLLTTTDVIARGGRTQGWRSLGFSGDDYRLAVNGDEDPGTYTTTVTYTIAAP